MALEFDVLVALETLIGTIPTFGTVSIGLEEDMFHSVGKWKGNLPAVFLEYRGDEEEGPMESSFERFVPFTVIAMIVQKAQSGKANRRQKIEDAINFKNLIKDKIDSDPQLGGLQVTVSPVGPARILAADERVSTPYWAIEIDLPFSIFEVQGAR